jgi:hypothetical protein
MWKLFTTPLQKEEATVIPKKLRREVSTNIKCHVRLKFDVLKDEHSLGCVAILGFVKRELGENMNISPVVRGEEGSPHEGRGHF